ncbi:MAG: bifunctional (p)ppGpp synthetase/guanosine-3',5'-bis(diphosphate) 3'-pyrophosphohydrolase [Sphingomonadaceae bacterium]|uniref:RelA/SpoT family protein n=1 Tax=Thermaurantiacus sp. TaxID=2820283 RepID=UPI00298F2E1C|nr:bifunctional (p)ppGpp synthetase/guanosine-3',5'-bis(diphosphate) 3'-pyrophosphohydrolase [Thermaurantiacus sp.]MCS6986510.1 bifunctional (p)ppGpp synthetase/guanosine-3',5'-bis(diphosphate) 3'-pyrophosphohydrolase [Sphingomonadaceae bacterium]MDW8414229.1 bifunctional (p)ppGpp synthetase/guanosine-3',5'-bis(diphosphate) 3'-pyrophosphohydrolase [Thermaurantiacus sp.]
MLRQYELVEKVRAYDPDADEELLNRAYVFSMKAHGSQRRASGDPYFSHPIEVAGILTDLRLDDETIATAILHDTLEDTVATREEIERLFGPNVARLVEGVTKLSRIEAQSESERAAENLRRFVLAMSDDIRVLVVKLADRLHNMRTLHHLKDPAKRHRIARETWDIYAPLAERIGLYGFMDELRDLAFRELEPDAFASISARLAALRAQGHDVIGRIEQVIRDTLAARGVPFEDVRGREKRPWSIFRKMQEREVGFEQIADVMAFRIITPTADDCYRALGALHQRWPMVPGRFKDYISTPKRNGYRSLHTTLIDRDKLRIEVQIRDPAMHAEAEYGMAAHWAYKQRQGTSGASYPWLSDLLEILEQAQTPEEVLEHTRMAMFQDKLFCFTPKGELIQLPQGATAVDFAYAVHTELGDTAVGARVNGKDVPLRTVLKNGDQVEILRSSGQTPDPAWESFVVTAKARAAIRRHLRARERARLLATGRALFERIVKTLKVDLGEAAIAAALERLRLADLNQLHLALARGTLSDEAVMEALLPGSTARRKRRRRAVPSPSGALLVNPATTGAGGIELGACCLPIPGDRIVGIRKAGHGIMAHRIDCPALAKEEGADWIDLAWDPHASSGVARIAVTVLNVPGALAQVTELLARLSVNIVNLRLDARDRAHHHYVLEVDVEDLAHLTDLVNGLKALSAVTSAARHLGA